METNSLAIIYALNLHSSLESTMLDYNIFVFCRVHRINSLHRQLNMMSPIHYINLLCTNQHVIAYLLSFKFKRRTIRMSLFNKIPTYFIVNVFYSLLHCSLEYMKSVWNFFFVNLLFYMCFWRCGFLILLFFYIRQYYCWHFMKLGTSGACSTSSCLINS
jgi:hypothetical protein